MIEKPRIESQIGNNILRNEFSVLILRVQTAPTDSRDSAQWSSRMIVASGAPTWMLCILHVTGPGFKSRLSPIFCFCFCSRQRLVEHYGRSVDNQVAWVLAVCEKNWETRSRGMWGRVASMSMGTRRQKYAYCTADEGQRRRHTHMWSLTRAGCEELELVLRYLQDRAHGTDPIALLPTSRNYNLHLPLMASSSLRSLAVSFLGDRKLHAN